MGQPMAAHLVLASCLAATAAAGDAPHGFGKVAFQNSGAPSAQAAFLSGLALLHDFEYERAATQFRTAETADPAFAMAYWGEAMTHNHPIWMQQDLAAARAALDRLAPTADARLARAPTEREKDYLRAIEILYGQGTKEERDLRYSDAMGELHRRFPDDADAAALFALSILGTAHNGRDIPTYMKAAAILEQLRCQYPDHPGVAHYLIHSVDDPVHAILGLDAARAYSRIAPEAAHAQHMCSHIFLALGLWDDVVAANETAVAVVNRQRREQGKAPRACGHYSFWLEYGYLQQGRVRKAGEALDACRTEAEASPRPAGDAEAIDPDDSTLGSFAQMRTRYVLDSEDWSGAEVGTKLDTGGAVLPRFSEALANGFAAVGRGDLPAARSLIEELEALSVRLPALYDKAGDTAPEWFRKVPGIEIEELRATLLEAEGKAEEAVALARKAASDEAMLPIAFGPPVVDKPTSELLGEILLRQKRPAEAKKAFEAALERTPERTSALLGLLRAERALGNRPAADAAARRLRQIWHAADRLPDDL
jgi:tetratricopeptide (TPR) repeat protein